jgi:hypothetical protein
VGGGEGRRQPQVDELVLLGRHGGEPLGGSDRHVVVEGLVRAVGVVLGDPGIQGGLGGFSEPGRKHERACFHAEPLASL